MSTLNPPIDDGAAYVDHERPVLAMLSTRYRDLDPDGRRELYHEAWASVLVRRRSGAEIENLRGYLLGAADKLASKRVYGADARRRRTFDPAGQYFNSLPDSAELPEERVVAIDEARRVRMLVDELGTSERDLFIALGGTSYAVAINSIGTREVKNNSLRSTDVRNGALTSKDVKRGSLGGAAVKESTLGTVARAKAADRVGRKSSSQLTVRCPSGTRPNMGACIELIARPEQAYGTAKVACETVNRRLPMHQELEAYGDDSPTALAPRGELTSSVYPGNPVSEPLQVLIITSSAGSVDVVPDTFAGSRQFRCVATPSN